MGVLLQANGLDKKYGSTVLLDEASVSFNETMKVGMIGRNGAGKSTFCRILLGEEEPDHGEVTHGSDLRLGYLEQHDPFSPDETLIGFLVRHTGKEEWKCGRIAGRFGLKHGLLETPMGALSGGFRTRAKLAAMLLFEPNFLVLDEPTNFLDLGTLLLLQEFLRDFRGGALLVSHDREFLKRTCDHTLEVERGRLVLYPGDVEEYLAFKEEQADLARRTNETIKAKKAQLQEFVDRFKAKASKASQARSKMKEIERMKTIAIEHPLATVRLRIPRVEPKKGVAFSLRDLEVGYPEKRIAGGIHLDVERGARVAVVGDNGQGKTTLLRTLAGDLAPRAGEVRRSSGLEVGYYAQHVYGLLDPDDTVLSHLERMAPREVPRQEVLDMAGCFLFGGEDVRKTLGVLSGGERARLTLAGLLLARRTALLLDEPTNHLDFETVEALGRALAKWEGTVVFISHDRTFVSMVATEVLEIDSGRVVQVPGGYQAYVDRLERRAREASSLSAPRGAEARPSGAGGTPASAADEHRERKRLRNERARLESGIAAAEKRMRALEAEKEALLASLQGAPDDPAEDVYARLDGLVAAERAAEQEWIEFQGKLEALGKEP